MRHSVLSLIALLPWLVAQPALASHEAELWRTPFGEARAVSVDPSNGSCWAAVGSWVIHYTEDGTELSRTNLWYPRSVSVSPADGSCWVADQGHSGPRMWAGASEVIRLAADGSVLSRTGGFLCPISVSADPGDGSCWVADWGDSTPWAADGAVVHLAPDGTRLWQGTGAFFHHPLAVAVHPSDGSCWVTDVWDSESGGEEADWGCYLLHLAADGSLSWRSEALSSAVSRLWMAVDTRDGSVWALTDPGLSHFDAVGNTQQQITDDLAWAAAVDPTDSSIWLASLGVDDQPSLRHLTSGLTQLWQGLSPSPEYRFAYEQGLCDFSVTPTVNPSDGSLWVAGSDVAPDQYATWGAVIARIGSDGTELWRQQQRMSRPSWPAVASADGQLWFADAGNSWVVRLASDGTELLRSANRYLLGGPWLYAGGWPSPRLMAYPSDGSCWLIDRGTDIAAGDSGSRLVRLGPDGAEVAHTPPLPPHCRIDGLAVDLRDGSVWMAYCTPGSLSLPTDENVSHYSAGGEALWSKAYAPDSGGVRSIALDSRDGSVWFTTLASSYTGVVHLDQTGHEIWRGGSIDPTTGFPILVTASPSDGACWAIYSLGIGQGMGYPYDTDLVCFNADGSERWRRSDLCVANMAFDPVTDLCWIVSDMEILILDRNGEEQWRTGGFGPWPQGLSVNPVDGSCWVTDSLNDQIVKLKLPGPFRDVPFFDWAAAYIAACVNAGIVGGYPDGWYHPHTAVTRDAMAVFVARALAGGDSNVPTGPATATFPDVPVGFWAFKYVEYAHTHGVVSGYPNGTYGPTITVDRATMAVFVARAIVGGDTNVPPGPATAFFPDVPTGFWAFKYVEYIRSQSVTGGYPDGHYHPEYVCTRDQMAVFVQRAFALPM